MKLRPSPFGLAIPKEERRIKPSLPYGYGRADATFANLHSFGLFTRAASGHAGSRHENDLSKRLRDLRLNKFLIIGYRPWCLLGCIFYSSQIMAKIPGSPLAPFTRELLGDGYP